jgi:hypothetical protein
VGAELPARLDTEFLRTASRSLVVLGLLPALILAFVVRSVGTRLVPSMLGSAIFGLAHYRQTLERCDQPGSSCRLFGEVVEADNRS